MEFGDSRSILDKVMRHSPDMICAIDRQGSFVYVSDACRNILGYNMQELQGASCYSFIHPDDYNATVQVGKSLVYTNSTTYFRNRYRHKNGEWVPVAWSVNWSAEEQTFFCIARIPSESEVLSRQVQEKEEVHNALVEHGVDMLALFNTEGDFVYSGGSTLRKLGYEPEQLIGRNAFEFIHPHDTPKLKEAMRTALSTEEQVKVSDFRFKSATGEWKWLETTLRNQLYNASINAVVSSSRDITDRKNRLQRIRQSEQRFRSLFEYNPDIILIEDRDSTILDINPAGLLFFGADRESIVNNKLSAILPKEIAPVCMHYLQEAFTNKSVAFHLTLPVKEGDHKDIFVTKVPIIVDDEIIGVFAIVRDVTDVTQSQQELKKLSLVASGTDNGVVITGANGQIEWVNESFTRTTGYTLPEVVGKKPGSFMQGPETDPAAVQRISEKLEEGVHFNTVLINYKKSGEKLWLSIDITPIYNDEGQITQFIAIQKDITFRKEVEASQQQMAQDLYRHNRDLQQFTYIVSHNLRAPVANVLGLATLLPKLDRNSTVYDKALASLTASVWQMDTVLKDVNTILTTRDSKGNYVQEQVNILYVVQQATSALQDLLHISGADVKLTIPEDYTVEGNNAYLNSIFYNLLSNALKYRSPDRNLEVTIKCFGSPQRGTIISFTDNGLGFNMEKHGSNLFKLYKRFHTGIADGRGLGLFMVKTQIEAMGGRIEVSSQVNVGTRFMIYLT
ncbi:PAS domain S-box protein [Pontibacter sp. SGAir0037]|uniref:PAS domain-containing protein n=1 Tax=Pontibacter sp. SGAir0037 TaxID=2571030 RepID=UPI0010CCBF0D|nr:PAS domain S-box protein [Pontibacter sp. SGAir0037]QCR23586.1 hypothetical protein C1N53_15355 [Pontibacter sp. SGAir0037]